MATPSTSRGSSWSDNEVRALISIWGEDNIQEELDGAVRNQVIFNNIATKMRERGYERDWQQCRTKIKNLKKRIQADKGSQWANWKREESLQILQGAGQHLRSPPSIGTSSFAGHWYHQQQQQFH